MLLFAMVTLCQVLLFEQPGCASCKQSYRELSQHPSISLQVYDVTKERSLANSYGVFGAPVAIFLREGKEIGRVYGYNPSLLRSLVDRCL
ncbi:MAG: thioredoxin [Acidobacteria bacterium]|nr:MAG: thioredoxin [Acidobacteriota bacterium]